MRFSLSFGGVPHRDRNPRHYRYHRHHQHLCSGITITLGPLGSAIVGLVFAIIGIFVALISLWNPILLIVSVFFVVVGIICFVSNIKRIRNKKDKDSSLEK